MLLLDSQENLYLTGATSAGNTTHWRTIKYSSAGLPLWTNDISQTPLPVSILFNMAVDKNQNVVLTGQAHSPSTGYDFATIGLNSSGVARWTNYYNIITNSTDYPWYIALGTNDEVYVAGPRLDGSVRTPSPAGFVAYSAEGVPLWSNRSIYATPCGLKVNAHGLVILSGGVAGGGILTIAHAPEGTPVWTNFIPDAVPYAVTAVPDGGVVTLAASTQSPGGKAPIEVIKLSSTGVALWTNYFSNPDSIYDAANGIIADSDGTVFVELTSQLPNSIADLLLLAYSNTGTPLWTNVYNSTICSSQTPANMAVDGVGNLIVATTCDAGATTELWTLISYSRAGLPLWTNLTTVAPQTLTGLQVGKDGSFVVAGQYYNMTKYALSVPLAVQNQTPGPVLNWSNSAFGWTNLRFQLQSAFDLNGTFTNIPAADNPFTNHSTASQGVFRLIPQL